MTDDAEEKKSQDYEKQRKNIETKLPQFKNQHKNWFGFGYLSCLYRFTNYNYSIVNLLIYFIMTHYSLSTGTDAFEMAIQQQAVKTTTKGCVVVEYSAKAIAVFGATKAIKDELKAMGGRFNPKLTYNGEKKAGWIFPKSKKEDLDQLINNK